MNTRQKKCVRLVHLASMVMIAAVFFSGCSSPSVEHHGDKRPNHLETVYNAYIAATQKMKRPPQNKEELKPFLPKDVSLDTVMKSVYDDEEYVVAWGFDPVNAANNSPDLIIFAYEQKGSDQYRWVATTMGVMQKTPQEFQTAKFPPGHNP